MPLIWGKDWFARWPDGYVLMVGPYITEDGYDAGHTEALFDDHPALVDYFAMRRADDPKSFADGG